MISLPKKVTESLAGPIGATFSKTRALCPWGVTKIGRSLFNKQKRLPVHLKQQTHQGKASAWSFDCQMHSLRKSHRTSPCKMLTLVLLSFLWAGASDGSAQARVSSSYSGEFGGDAGSHFDQSDHEPEGPITALRVRANDRYIVSIQVRYGDSWSNTEGGLVGSPSNVRLFLGEGIVQVLGRFGSHVEYLALRTNQGRIFAFGPNFGPGTFFNAEPSFPSTVLRSVNGRSGSLVDAIGFHWDAEQ